jgi:GNAT superfamily N-acetyltransferase
MPDMTICPATIPVPAGAAGDVLSAADCAALAALHVQCLPDSLVSQLGRRYAAAFYRYVSRSPRELVLVEREGTAVAAGCVLSSSPATLTRRLALRTPLLPWAVLHIATVLKALWPSRGRTPAPHDELPHGMPEVLLIFTDPAARGRGRGAALLGRCEEFLIGRGCGAYGVRTVDDLGNAALRFYAKQGFVACGQCVQHGRPFRLLSKKL